MGFGVGSLILKKSCQSYLDNQIQYKSNDCEDSLMATIDCGVSLGSVLGPLLYM